jgi:hypothetical protein
VVARGGPLRPIGYLGRAEIIAARLRHANEEDTREPGWIAGLTKP